jgi:hypothetical protein
MARIGLIAALWLSAVGLFIPSVVQAQTGVTRSSQSDVTVPDQSGGTLEVPPRVLAPPPPPANSTPVPESSASTDAADTGLPDPAAVDQALRDATQPDKSTKSLPYLGISVQYIVSNDTRGPAVRGLEVVSVDPASPAEQAGLHGRGQMTKLGASGSTAGELMAPLNLIILPLLKKAGDLGEDGDLIIAIDDSRVEAESDLEDALGSLKPGDVVYLTVVRQHQDNKHETLKLPVRLGPPREAETSP